MSITKITRRELRRLINEAPKKANNWAEYVATGKNNTAKTLRKKIQINWALVANNDKLYPADSKKSYAPGNFENTYDGWVKWYKACSASSDAMKLIDKRANEAISPTEMIELYLKIIPFQLAEDFLALIKDTKDRKLVNDFINGVEMNNPEQGEATLKVLADSAIETSQARTKTKNQAQTKKKGTTNTDSEIDPKDEDDSEEFSGFGNEPIVDQEKDFGPMNESIITKRWKRLSGI